MTISPTVDALIRVFEEEKPPSLEGSRFAVSRTVSLIAVLYEKARNAVEFRAEHLIRRAAIERIMKRRILLNGGSTDIADSLITELLWARYIDSSLVDDAKVSHIQRIIDRYIYLKRHTFDTSAKPKGIPWDTIVGLAASEIEEAIVSAKKRRALTDFFYQSIRPKIHITSEDEKFVNMQTYIAVERAYDQADDPLILYHVMDMIAPDWFTLDANDVPQHVNTFFTNIALVQTNLSNPVNEPLYRYVRKQTAPFLLIRDFFLDNEANARSIIEAGDQFEMKLSELSARRYQEIGAKVRRAIVRSIIYIFLTKMIFALALEAPFDYFISRKVAYIPLAINTVFPPVLLFLVAGFISVPGQENTQRLIDRVKKIVYRFDELREEKDLFTSRQRVRRPLLTAAFSIVYLGTFLLSFGVMSLILSRLHFNVASQVIFFFFVTLVSFFAYRIRQSAKEYEVVDRQGFLGPVVDFFFLPVLRVGHVLSREIAKLNVFIFIFDFILEAPLKVIFELVEEWIRFIRTKKEEII